MKALLIALIFSFGLQANAEITVYEDMTPEQTRLVIALIESIDPDDLEKALQPEVFEWYMTYLEATDEEIEEASLEHGRMELGYNPYKDPNAPTFN